MPVIHCSCRYESYGLSVLFWPAVRYYIKKEAIEPRQPSGNAFSVMMSAQRQVSAQRLPPSIEQPCNKKDELQYVVGFLEEGAAMLDILGSCSWSGSLFCKDPH